MAQPAPDVSTLPWKDQLTHASPSVRLRALLHEEAREDRLPHLLEVFPQEGDPHVLEALTWALARTGAPAQVPLQGLLSDPDPEVRRRSVHALGKLPGTDITPALLPLLSDPDERVLAKTIMVLGQRTDPQAVPHLLELLADPRPEISTRTLDALESYGPSAREMLVLYIHDPRDIVRERVADLLGFLRELETIPHLTTLLEDPSAHVRSSAILALDASLRAYQGETDSLLDEDNLLREEGLMLLDARLVDTNDQVQILARRLWQEHAHRTWEATPQG